MVESARHPCEPSGSCRSLRCIVLNFGPHLAVRPVLNLLLHTGVATAGDFTTRRKHGFGRRTLERTSEGVAADPSDVFGQRPLAALLLDPEQAGNPHRVAQKDSLAHLLPRVLRKLPALGQSVYQTGKAEHHAGISFEPG